MSLETFTAAYIECALWSETDNSDETGGAPLDASHWPEDIAPESLARMRADCAKFYEAHGASIEDDEQAGRDFWLTRNGHGAGFWDGDWPEPLATTLMEASKTFGECSLYIGDDKKVYLA